MTESQMCIKCKRIEPHHFRAKQYGTDGAFKAVLRCDKCGHWEFEGD